MIAPTNILRCVNGGTALAVRGWCMSLIGGIYVQLVAFDLFLIFTSIFFIIISTSSYCFYYLPNIIILIIAVAIDRSVSVRSTLVCLDCFKASPPNADLSECARVQCRCALQYAKYGSWIQSNWDFLQAELPKHSEGGVGLLAIQGSQIPGLDIIRPAHPWYRRASESSVVIQRAFLFHNIGHIGDAANVGTAIDTAARLKLLRQKLRFQLNNFCSSGFGNDWNISSGKGDPFQQPGY